MIRLLPVDLLMALDVLSHAPMLPSLLLFHPTTQLLCCSAFGTIRPTDCLNVTSLGFTIFLVTHFFYFSPRSPALFVDCQSLLCLNTVPTTSFILSPNVAALVKQAPPLNHLIRSFDKSLVRDLIRLGHHQSPLGTCLNRYN